METSQLICRANQLTSFYMMGTMVVKGLMEFLNNMFKRSLVALTFTRKFPEKATIW